MRHLHPFPHHRLLLEPRGLMPLPESYGGGVLGSPFTMPGLAPMPYAAGGESADSALHLVSGQQAFDGRRCTAGTPQAYFQQPYAQDFHADGGSAAGWALQQPYGTAAAMPPLPPQQQRHARCRSGSGVNAAMLPSSFSPGFGHSSAESPRQRQQQLLQPLSPGVPLSHYPSAAGMAMSGQLQGSYPGLSPSGMPQQGGHLYRSESVEMGSLHVRTSNGSGGGGGYNGGGGSGGGGAYGRPPMQRTHSMGGAELNVMAARQAAEGNSWGHVFDMKRWVGLPAAREMQLLKHGFICSLLPAPCCCSGGA